MNAPFSTRSPRLDKTTSGEGVPLIEVVQVEVLEKHVKNLERLVRDADMEMEEVIGRMNRAQVDVVQLQSDRYVFQFFSEIYLTGRVSGLRRTETNQSTYRDEALRQTRRLQADIQAERDTLQTLMGHA
jgi:hypothetical protein